MVVYKQVFEFDEFKEDTRLVYGKLNMNWSIQNGHYLNRFITNNFVKIGRRMIYFTVQQIKLRYPFYGALNMKLVY